MLPVSLLLILVLRVGMIVDVIPAKAISSRFHSWKAWPDTLRQRTNGLPIVWLNSYQRASKYAFYSKQTTHSLNFYRERRNNYNFWSIEDSLQNKPVVIADIYDMHRFTDSIQTPIGWVGYRIDSSFQGTSKYWFEPFTNNIEARSGDSIRISGWFRLPSIGGQIESCRIGVFQNGKWLADWGVEGKIWYPSSDSEEFIITLKQNLPPGNYVLVFALNARGLPPTHNSRKIQLIIK